MTIDFRKTAFLMERVRTFSSALKCYHIKNDLLVDQNTANIRAKLCVSCHNNVDKSKALDGVILGLTEDQKVMDQMSGTILQGRTTSHDTQLKSCNICGTHNKLAIWLFPEYLLKRQDANAFPSFCWKKEVL